MSYKAMCMVRTVLQKELLSKSMQRLRLFSSHYSTIPKFNKEIRELKTETSIVYPSDPDTFGTLAGKWPKKLPEDEADQEEEEYNQNIPLRSQQLSTKQYADLIKQYVKHKHLKEALDVLEIKMIKEDRVKPESYIYNILIGACADMGYTKKAFKLYNDMKRRALKVTGDTYTCLFTACANSPWPADGLKNAAHLRQLMREKGVEPNLTNYNSMIKAFGRCGDLSTAFQIVDEMVSKKIKLRVHTFNFLLQACITDKQNGLRHAVLVWRKMLLKKEKPNIYSFNLMLKCAKECNFGSEEDIVEALAILAKSGPLKSIPNHKTAEQNKLLKIESEVETDRIHTAQSTEKSQTANLTDNNNSGGTDINVTNEKPETVDLVNNNEYPEKIEATQLQFINDHSLNARQPERKVLPNLLSRNLQIDEVVSLQEVKTPQERFAFIGGQSGFLDEMKVYSVVPDLKTLTQMLPLIPDTEKAEKELMDTMKELGVRADIEFYNSLMRKRCFRSDYDAALTVKSIIEEENKLRKKKHPMKKHIQLKLNLLTYGALAMTCKTKEDAVKMIEEMEQAMIKINIEILGSMLSQAVAHFDFGYIKYILNIVKQQSLKPNDIFMLHLEKFHNYCEDRIEKNEKGRNQCSSAFVTAHNFHRKFFQEWLHEMETSGALYPAHPWQQFRENQPETVQRQNLIKPPRRYTTVKFRHPKPYRV